MSRRVKRKARFFTLFETLIVVGIIALVIGGGGFALVRATKKERFEKEVQKVRSKVALCQEIALVYDTDCTLLLTTTPDGLKVMVTLHGKLPPFISAELYLPTTLSSISTCAFNDLPKEHIHLFFDATSLSPPQGKLTLTGTTTKSLWLHAPSKKGGDHLTNKGEADAPPPYPQEATLLPFS